ncbi:DUF2201 family putative metallopeptidase [Caldimonas tepidiphila]|uniref:vWA domain-containing protein n=1 Tax=Caldimonas tepidiphila TaxID=2315841 RepID=UPI00130017FA|nr:VWA-like domain-containing protein [Caldimonas tepidiphila]
MSRRDDKPYKLPPFVVARKMLRAHPLLGPVSEGTEVFEASSLRGRNLPQPGGRAYCCIDGRYAIFIQDTLSLDVPTWLGVLSLATLVLALGAPARLPTPSHRSDLAAQLAALHWWRSLKIGRLPEHFELEPEFLAWGRLPLEEIAARLEHDPLAEQLGSDWTLTRSADALLMHPSERVSIRRLAGIQTRTPDQLFAEALVDNARQVLRAQRDEPKATRGADPNGPVAQAWRWLIAHYPLLGSLLARFELVEDVQVCQGQQISIAAIHLGLGEIYVNPLARLNLEQAKFVLAHEVLHAGLCHGSRRQGRDPFLWNVACDFVINHWLIEMRLGAPPPGLLHDEHFRGWAAEDIYRSLAADLRARRRLRTLRGAAVDVLDDGPRGALADREAFCRRALAQGLDWHQAEGRGLLPAGLVEEIRTLNQPPIPWQAQLAEWIREHFPLPEKRRSYARPSRRQSATPDIPRPRFVAPEEERLARTFGVVIDSSGSMDREDLGKALGAVASYAQAQEVKQVRLVYCDAQPYDEGYVEVESLARRVKVRGRGGTVLQPAVTLLETREDFPKDAPVLVITDGGCEEDLTVKRNHAFLLTPGARLPFATRKPVFGMA